MTDVVKDEDLEKAIMKDMNKYADESKLAGFEKIKAIKLTLD